MSEILTPEEYEREWWDILETRSMGYESFYDVNPETRATLKAHDAALRAENERLALSLVDAEDRLAAALDDRAFLLELLGITVKTGTKDPLLDARLAEARAFLAGGKTK